MIHNGLPSTLPDVLRTDIERSDEDGYDLLESVRGLADAAAKTLPGVAFTAYGSEADSKRATAAGFALHIAKRVQPSILVTRIAALVRTTRYTPHAIR